MQEVEKAAAEYTAEERQKAWGDLYERFGEVPVPEREVWKLQADINRQRPSQPSPAGEVEQCLEEVGLNRCQRKAGHSGYHWSVRQMTWGKAAEFDDPDVEPFLLAYCKTIFSEAMLSSLSAGAGERERAIRECAGIVSGMATRSRQSAQFWYRKNERDEGRRHDWEANELERAQREVLALLAPHSSAKEMEDAG